MEFGLKSARTDGWESPSDMSSTHGTQNPPIPDQQPAQARAAAFDVRSRSIHNTCNCCASHSWQQQARLLVKLSVPNTCVALPQGTDCTHGPGSTAGWVCRQAARSALRHEAAQCHAAQAHSTTKAQDGLQLVLLQLVPQVPAVSPATASVPAPAPCCSKSAASRAGTASTAAACRSRAPQQPAVRKLLSSSCAACRCAHRLHRGRLSPRRQRPQMSPVCRIPALDGVHTACDPGAHTQAAKLGERGM